MKIKKILMISMLLFSAISFAQDGNMRQKKAQIRSMKVAFITTEVALTANEAEKFWPIYNMYDNKQFELRQQKLRAYQKRLDDAVIDKMTDTEAGVLLSQIENTEQELYELRRKYNANLKNVLSPLKILKLKKAEEDFNRNLLRQYRGKKKQ